MVNAVAPGAVASKVTAYVGDLEVTDTSPGTTGGLTATRFLTFGGATVATVTSGSPTPSWSLLLGDGQGSAQVAMELVPVASGTGLAAASSAHAVTRNAYLPFGATRGGDHLATSRGWLGQVADTYTGLIYLNARYYDPVLARFISPDPLMNPGDPKTLDPYRYADNNPVMMTDATGLYSNVCGGLTGSAKHACDASASHYKPIGSKSGFTPGSPGGGGSSAMPPRSGPRTSSRPPTVNGDDSYRPTMDGRIYRNGQFDCVAGANQCVYNSLVAQGPSPSLTPVQSAWGMVILGGLILLGGAVCVPAALACAEGAAVGVAGEATALGVGAIVGGDGSAVILDPALANAAAVLEVEAGSEAVVAYVGARAAASGIQSAEGAYVTLYRAVGPDEFLDIATSGTLRIAGNSTNGKYFWESQVSAESFLNSVAMNGDGVVVSVRVPAAVAEDASAAWPNLDGLGPARYYEGQQWENLQSAIGDSVSVG